MENENTQPLEGAEQQTPTPEDSQSFSFVSEEEVAQMNATPEPPIVEEPEANQVTEENTYRDSEYESSEQEEYTQEDVESAVANYLSERLGREITNLDDVFETQQERELDERISAIADFVQDTGRSPQDWFIYQQLDPSEMDDMTAIQVQMASDYPNLSQDEVSTLMGSKYKLDSDLHSEDEVKLSQLQLKIDAQNARQGIEELRGKYSTPNVESEEDQSLFDDQWMSSMQSETAALDGVEFDLGNGKSFTFGLDDGYRSDLMERNARLDEFFDPYVQKDGSWDYDSLNVHRAVIDNMEAIVQSVYKQGMSDGQRGLVNQAANVSTQTPNQTGQTQESSLAAQLKQALGGGNSWTF